MAAIAVTNTFVSSTPILASAVNQNFTDIVNGLSDGTKDLTVLSLTATTLTINGNTTLGDASSDTITVNGTMAFNTAPTLLAGSVATPGLSFTLETALGFSRDAAGSVTLSSNNASQARLIIRTQQAAADAALYVTCSTAATGDAYILFRNSDGSGTSWGIGRDTSDSSAIKISKNDGNLGTNDYFAISTTGSVVLNNAAIATNATDGFLYIASCAGAPSGTPTTKTGRVPLVIDSTNSKIYAYIGSWKAVTVS
jgi:hypothetical protein